METPDRGRLDDLRSALDRWVAEGLIEGAQADRIAASEGVRADGGSTAQPSAATVAPAESSSTSSPETRVIAPASRVPLVAEVLGYAGGVLAIGALITMLGSNWDALTEPARLAILGTATVIIWLAGLGLGGNEQPAVRRLGSVLWAISVAAFAATATVLFADVLDHDDKATAAIITSMTLVVCVVLWYFRRAALQHLATAIAIASTEVAIISIPDDQPGELVYGMVFWVTGFAWLLFTWAGRLHPRPLAYLLGVGAMLLGPQLSVFQETEVGIIVGMLTAICISAFGLQQRSTDLVVLGGIGLLIFLPQASVHWIGDSVGAAMALFVGGLTIIGVAVTIARMRSES